EDANLARLVQAGASVEQIAQQMERHVGAIQRRIEKRALTYSSQQEKGKASSMDHDNIRVAVCGAAGRMGREVIRAVMEADGMHLVAAVDRHEIGADVGELAQDGKLNIRIESDLHAVLERSEPHVLVDFTVPDAVMLNARTALTHGVSPVIGTTGLSAKDLKEIDRKANEKGIGAFVAPNFAIGA